LAISEALSTGNGIDTELKLNEEEKLDAAEDEEKESDAALDGNCSVGQAD